jgi:hypothetical protein
MTLFCETSWLRKLLVLHDDEVETRMVYDRLDCRVWEATEPDTRPNGVTL